MHEFTFNGARPFGEQLRAWRVAKGMTQGELSRALSEVQSRISLYELGRAPFPHRRLDALLDLFPFDDATAERIRFHVERTGQASRAQVDDLPPVGQALRRLRFEKDITLHEMASLLGTSYARVSNIERGVYRMQPTDLYRLREVFSDEKDTEPVMRAYHEMHVKADGESFESFLSSLERVVLTNRLVEATGSMDVAALAALVRQVERGGVSDGTG